MSAGAELRRPFDPAALRVVLVTDGRGDVARAEWLVAEAIAGGVRAVQLREPAWSARTLLRVCERLLPVLQAVDGLLLVNDRVDVAAAGAAHGAQVGSRSLPPELARAVLGPRRVLGYSAHDGGELDLAAAAGCDFALLSPVWPTASKPGAPHLGAARAAWLTARARLPVVWLGGVAVPLLACLRDAPAAGRPVGVAVRSALGDAPDPRASAAELVAAVATAIA